MDHSLSHQNNHSSDLFHFSKKQGREKSPNGARPTPRPQKPGGLVCIIFIVETFGLFFQALCFCKVLLTIQNYDSHTVYNGNFHWRCELTPWSQWAQNISPCELLGIWDGIVGYLTLHEAYCLWEGNHSGHNLHTQGWGDMKMKSQSTLDSNPVPPN